MPGSFDQRSAGQARKQTRLFFCGLVGIIAVGLASDGWARGGDEEPTRAGGPRQDDEGRDDSPDDIESDDAALDDDEWGDAGPGDDSSGDDGWGDDSESDPFADLVVEGPATNSGFTDSSISAGGFVRSRVGLWVERVGDNPFASARQSLDTWFRYRRGVIGIVLEGHAEYDFAYLYRRDSYDEPTLDAHESYFDTREAKIELSLGSTLLSFGRQIIPLGESNLITPTDASNPYDLREIGLANVADLRLPILATRLSHAIGTSQLELVVMHESRFDLRSPPYGPFSGLPEVLGPPGPETYQYRDLQGRFDLSQQEAFLRGRATLAGVDLSLAAGSVLDNRGVIVLPTAPPSSDIVDIDLDHRRYAFLASSANYPVDSWLFRLDLGVIFDLPLEVWDGQDILSLDIDETPVAQMVLGTDYSGVEDTLISVELNKNIYLGEALNALVDYDIIALAIRAERTFLKDDLALTLTSILQGESLQYGWFARLDVAYRLREGLETSMGYVTYQPGDEFSLLTGLDSHDRLFGQIRWDSSIL